VSQYRTRAELPRTSLSERRPYHFKSSDGLDIPAYLTLPKGLPAKNLPLIVFPHGGPWGRDSFGYDTFARFLSNRGYAVLQPNFRGSTGYGKKFLNAGNGEWGRKMQDDLTWGVKALVADGTADPKRTGIIYLVPLETGIWQIVSARREFRHPGEGEIQLPPAPCLRLHLLGTSLLTNSRGLSH
jgi:Prolyl oligopeptidase family